jgi:hypothetical protein
MRFVRTIFALVWSAKMMQAIVSASCSLADKLVFVVQPVSGEFADRSSERAADRLRHAALGV